MSFLNDLEDVATSGLDALEDAAQTALQTVENTAAVIVEGAEVLYEWTEDQLTSAVDALGDLGESLEDVLDDALAELGDIGREFEGLLTDAVDVLEDGWAAFTDAVEDAAAWVLEALEDIGDFVLDQLLPMAWGIIKLAVVGYILVAAGLALVLGGMLWWLLPAAALSVLLCTANKKEWGETYGVVLRDIVAGTPQMQAAYRTTRLPGAGKYFITSDHHRYPAGNLDTFAEMGSSKLYQDMLKHYAATQWTLIENGDMEDFWLRGGSARGVVFDIASTLPSPVADAIYEDGASHAAVRNLLARTILNPVNTQVYADVRTLFHDHGRYQRIAGNHDGAYQFEDVVETLRTVYPDLVMNDVVVLEGGGTTAVITHGHKTDAWSSDSCSFIGEAFVSISSAIRDVSTGWWAPGVKAPQDTFDLWDGKRHNEMMGPPAFNETLGASLDSDFSTMNEVALFDAVRRVYPEASHRPYVLLAHTHGPLVEPQRPGDAERWSRYYNDGSGLYWHMITGLEWEWNGTDPEPHVRLVAWRYADDVTCTTVQRHELVPTFDAEAPANSNLMLTRT